jgi:hypothetical protein
VFTQKFRVSSGASGNGSSSEYAGKGDKNKRKRGRDEQEGREDCQGESEEEAEAEEQEEDEEEDEEEVSPVRMTKNMRNKQRKLRAKAAEMDGDDGLELNHSAGDEDKVIMALLAKQELRNQKSNKASGSPAVGGFAQQQFSGKNGGPSSGNNQKQGSAGAATAAAAAKKQEEVEQLRLKVQEAYRLIRDKKRAQKN